jgi:hypothetical protein
LKYFWSVRSPFRISGSPTRVGRIPRAGSNVPVSGHVYWRTGAHPQDAMKLPAPSNEFTWPALLVDSAADVLPPEGDCWETFTSGFAYFTK